MSAIPLTRAVVQDWSLAQKIEKGIKTSTVTREEIMKTLDK